MRRLRREMRQLRREMRREMRRLRREMRQLRREMRREMRQLRREMRRLRYECVDCVKNALIASEPHAHSRDLWPHTLTYIDLWPHYTFMIMQIRPYPSLIFITPHEYSTPPLINIQHPSWIFSSTSDVTSLEGCVMRSEVELNIHDGWWILMRGGVEYSWGVMNINEGYGLICMIKSIKSIKKSIKSIKINKIN